MIRDQRAREQRENMKLFIIATHLGRARVLEVPEFHVPVTNRHEVGAVFGKRHSLHLGRNFVRGYFNSTPPVPYVDDHVVL